MENASRSNRSPLGLTGKEALYIDSVSQTGSRDALIEARLNAAFRFEKVNGRWVMREVRLGGRPWEKVEDFLKCMDAVKAEETRRMLTGVADAVSRYRQKKGALPAFKDFIGLSDLLTPEFLTPLVRQDAWNRPLAAFPAGSDGIRLVSPGPDGKLGSTDDIEVIRDYPR